MSTLRATRERMADVHAKLDLLLVLLLVFGRTWKDLRRKPLARTKRAVRSARAELMEARAELDRAFGRELHASGGTQVARQTS